MAKNVKKAKPTASKSTSKAPAKPAKKPAKAVASAKKSAPVAKAKTPAVKKAEPPKKAAKAPAAASAKKSAAPSPAASAKPVKAPKAEGKGKKTKRDSEMGDDDLMVSDEDMGAEEIPDLAEFDEDEEAVVEVEIEESEEVSLATVPAPSDTEAVLTDAEGRPYCKVKDCDQIAAVDAYCRYHYLLLWKKIQVRRKILVDGKLERYVEELTSRYPDKFLEMIRRDLRSDKDFQAAIAELEIDESAMDNEFEDEAQGLEEVRGFGSESTISDEEEF